MRLFLMLGILGGFASRCGQVPGEQNVARAFAKTDVIEIEPLADSLTFWRGMTFSHEGYQGYNGYGGEMMIPSLDSLAKLQVNALSIIPYTFMRQPDQVAELWIPDREGMETDEAVIATIKETHRRGWKVLLKPQIWLRGSWPGAIDFPDEESWQAWLGHYRTWMLHYAQMAADHQVEALCIGTELSRATLEQPEFWRKLISEIRDIYPGKLSYAANWGEEFEQISFWSDLDALGLNGYYPLSKNPQATDVELLQGAQAWMRRADTISMRAGRPLWLTEIGYRWVEGAWIDPHAEPGGRNSDKEAQARCYQALLAAASESQRLNGMFVWEWPSYLGHGYEEQGHDAREAWTGYPIGGGPAEVLLADWYANKSRASK